MCDAVCLIAIILLRGIRNTHTNRYIIYELNLRIEECLILIHYPKIDRVPVVWIVEEGSPINNDFGEEKKFHQSQLLD